MVLEIDRQPLRTSASRCEKPIRSGQRRRSQSACLLQKRINVSQDLVTSFLVFSVFCSLELAHIEMVGIDVVSTFASMVKT